MEMLQGRGEAGSKLWGVGKLSSQLLQGKPSAGPRHPSLPLTPPTERPFLCELDRRKGVMFLDARAPLGEGKPLPPRESPGWAVGTREQSEEEGGCYGLNCTPPAPKFIC